MALLAVGGHPVQRGTILMPRAGLWVADLDVDSDVTIEGPTQIEIAEGPTLVGTVLSGEMAYGHVGARLVGGAGGLGKEATPKHYVGLTVRTVLDDLVRTAGETLSSVILPSILNRGLPAWTVLRTSVGEQLAELVAYGLPDGTVWRILPDGTLWVGADTWPVSLVPTWTELERDPRNGRVVLGLDSPALLPGTVLGEDRIDYVEHRIEADAVRATAWLEGSLARGFLASVRASASVRSGVNRRGLYSAKVLAQSGDRSTVDVQPDDGSLPLMSKVPLKVSIPGATVKFSPGATVLVSWENGDPARAQAFMFNKGADTLVVSITAGDRVELGGENLIALLEQVVIGKTPCQFTGAPHYVAGQLSTKLYAKG